MAQFLSISSHIVKWPHPLGRILWPLMIKRTMANRVRTLNGLAKGHAKR
jgi:hypothetical protein